MMKKTRATCPRTSKRHFPPCSPTRSRGRPAPSAETLSSVLDFVTADGLSSARVRPARRPQGQGAFLREHLNIPLKRIIAYTLNPAVPGEAVYPSVVRRNAWLPGSEILVKGKELLATPLPAHGHVDREGNGVRGNHARRIQRLLLYLSPRPPLRAHLLQGPNCPVFHFLHAQPVRSRQYL